MQSESVIRDDYHVKNKSAASTTPHLSIELAELLNRLDLSPSVLLEEDALAIGKNSSCSSRAGSVHNADLEYGYPEQYSTTNTIERKALLEEFAMVRAESKIHVARNYFFHDQLVEHFKRKQMMWVYGEPSGEDSLTGKYEKKLSKYEQFREELQAGEENLKEEVNLQRKNVREKMEEADVAVGDLISKQRAAGAQAFANGKPLAAKEIQALIARELGKMKEITNVRVRYARLRDNLVEKETVFDALNILSPNLDEKDYKRLEAENFYYKHELRMKEHEAESLANRRDRVFRELKMVRRKRITLSQVILNRRVIMGELKIKIAARFQRRQMRWSKVRAVKKYFEKFESILGLRLYPEVYAKARDVQDQHKEWLDKIATMVKEIKAEDRCLKALRPQKMSHQLKDSTDDEDTDENTSLLQRSRRPPLGGGFLQALQRE